MLICGASFAGLAVARELAGAGADVLVVDRYEIGERQTSACAAPTPWLTRWASASAIRQELPCMAFHTPHGSVRYRLPWSWSSFDYRELCGALWAQCGDARFEIAKVERARAAGRAHRPRRPDRAADRRRARMAARARRRAQRPAAGGADLPRPRGASRRPRRRADLDVWVDRSLVRHGYAWSVPAAASSASGWGPTSRATTSRSRRRDRRRLGAPPVRYQGNWFPHPLRPAAEDGVFFVGDSAGHCFPLSGEGIRTAFYFGIACGRELRAVLAGERTRDEALAAYGAFSRSPRARLRAGAALQRLVPALPPRALTAAARGDGPRAAVRPRVRLVPAPGPPARTARRDHEAAFDAGDRAALVPEGGHEATGWAPRA